MPPLDLMTAAEIEKALEIATRNHTELLDAVIAAGFGNVRWSDLRQHLDGPHSALIAQHIAASDCLTAIRDEIDRRLRWHGSKRRIRQTA